MADVLERIHETIVAQGCLCLSSRCPLHGEGTGLLAATHNEVERLRWTIVELGSHVHDCEDLLSPRTMRTVSETRAALLASVTSPEGETDGG